MSDELPAKIARRLGSIEVLTLAHMIEREPAMTATPLDPADIACASILALLHNELVTWEDLGVCGLCRPTDLGRLVAAELSK